MKQKEPKDSAREFEQELRNTREEKYLLRLYVAGMTTKSKQAIQNIKQICEEHLKDRCDLEVIDVLRKLAFKTDNVILSFRSPVTRAQGPLVNTENLTRRGNNDQRSVISLNLMRVFPQFPVENYAPKVIDASRVCEYRLIFRGFLSFMGLYFF